MTVEGDALRKRVLFENWMAAHQVHTLAFAGQGEPIDRRTVLSRLTSLAGRQRASEYVYILSERRPQEEMPAYIGRARSPVTRWTQHLAGLPRGEASYVRWRSRFLREGHETVRFDLTLTVVGEASVQFSPLPGFPTTIGAVEYQLVGLAAEGFPLRLLNHEGQAR
ncbi:GIY-YIG nuclease family protein [Deinococcus navajonensis]|uniref:GIY-YIG nuclease family protein n=1 Tax=Deinococcus navajonensis TaxID=309884 RepID=A0ABV8XQJ0_9DEIO